MDELDDGIKPDAYPRWGLIGTIVWGTALMMIFIIIQIFIIGIYIGITKGAVTPAEAMKLVETLQFNGFVISLCIIVSATICSILILLIIKLKRGSNIKAYLGLFSVKPVQALRWGALIILLMGVWDIVSVSLGRPIVPEFMSLTYGSAKYPILFWVAFIAAAPIFEECFFRGFLLTGLSSSFIKPTGAIAVTSLIWAAIHTQYGWYELVFIFLLGCIFGAARLRTGSLLLTIGLHALINLIATIETIIHLASGTT